MAHSSAVSTPTNGPPNPLHHIRRDRDIPGREARRIAIRIQQDPFGLSLEPVQHVREPVQHVREYRLARQQLQAFELLKRTPRRRLINASIAVRHEDIGRSQRVPVIG